MEKDKGYSKTFWILGGACVVGLVGGLYYLYNMFSQEEDIPEEHAMQIEELKQEVEESNGELSTDLAIQIMAVTNRMAEDYLKKTKPDIDETRRAAIHNKEEYESLCNELFQFKEQAYQYATKKVLDQFGFSMEDLQKVMHKITPQDMERKLYEYDKPSFENKEIPDRAKVKEAFLFYGRKFQDEMKNFYSKMNEIGSHDPSNQEVIIFKLLVIKTQIDDELYFNYKYTETQIRYMLYEYNLFDDPDIRRMHESISRFDDMLGMSG